MAGNRILGLCFSSPAITTLMGMSNGFKVFLVEDATPKDTVKENLRTLLQGTAKRKLFVVEGLGNLRKLGPKAREDIHVVVHDVPELMACFLDEIRMGDAEKNGDSWKLVTMGIEGLVKRLNWSRYTTPINPKRVNEARASFIPALPSNDKKFDPTASITALVNSVREDHRDDFETGVAEFLAGLITRKGFTEVRRKALSRLPKKDVEAVSNFKSSFSTVQRWMESADEGRRVSIAYQICAARGMKAPVAARRTDAHLETLLWLMRNIPPSKRQSFKGWKAPREVT